MPTACQRRRIGGVRWTDLRRAAGNTHIRHSAPSRLDPAANKWVSFTSMPNPRHGVATAVLGNKLHLVSGNVTSGGGGDPKIYVHSEEHDVIEVPDCTKVTATSCP